MAPIFETGHGVLGSIVVAEEELEVTKKDPVKVAGVGELAWLAGDRLLERVVIACGLACPTNLFGVLGDIIECVIAGSAVTEDDVAE
jgi:hypothetical protein